MRIAIFFGNDQLSHIGGKNIHVAIFDMENDQVKGVENKILKERSVDGVLFFLQSECIDEIYVSEIDKATQKRLRSVGITSKTSSMLKNDKLFNTLYILPQA